jgi:hypothetical protein
MSTLRFDRPEELAAAEERFWPILEATLHVVYDADPDLATQYRRDLSDAPPLQRALALHDEPLDVATILTGRKPSSDRVAVYDMLISRYPDAQKAIPEHPERPSAPRDILATTPKDETAPMITVKVLNKLMEELGYQRLSINAGVASFVLGRKAWKRPLLKRYDMETLPGVDADREEVYRLDRVMTLLDALQEYARRRNPASTVAERIGKTKSRLLRSLGLND